MTNPQSEPSYFDPHGEIKITQNRLPHWQQDQAAYFVTWRLADSIPRVKLTQHQDEVAAWKKANPDPWDDKTKEAYHKIFSNRMDDWMDAGHGACLLRNHANAEVVKDGMLHFNGKRITVHTFVIMPNHIHVLLRIHEGWQLERIVHSWKRHSAVRINRRENRTGQALWQKDYFDRLIRNQNHFAHCVRYIRSNPQKARLPVGDFLLWESELAKSFA